MLPSLRWMSGPPRISVLGSERKEKKKEILGKSTLNPRVNYSFYKISRGERTDSGKIDAFHFETFSFQYFLPLQLALLCLYCPLVLRPSFSVRKKKAALEQQGRRRPPFFLPRQRLGRGRRKKIKMGRIFFGATARREEEVSAGELSSRWSPAFPPPPIFRLCTRGAPPPVQGGG